MVSLPRSGDESHGVCTAAPARSATSASLAARRSSTALRAMGHQVIGSDISPDDLSGLDQPADVVFPVLHGQFGESGELQEILERRGIAFVGSDSGASRLGMNKVATKQVWEQAGLPTPPYRVVQRGQAIGEIPGSCVVKAIDSGSSMDVFVCKAPAELPAAAQSAIEQVLLRHPAALIEQFIDGPELTIGILEEQPLAPIRIVPKSRVFRLQRQVSCERHGASFRHGPAAGADAALPRAGATGQRPAGGARSGPRGHDGGRGRQPLSTGDQHPSRFHAQKPVARSGAAGGD